MDKVTLYFNSTLAHFSQLITGLELLKEERKIELKYKLGLYSYPVHIFKIEYNGHSVFFDMSDNSDLDKNVLEESDFYVKRMLLIKDFNTHKKLIPFGLNYQVYFKNPFLQFLFFRNRKLLKYSLRYSKTASRALNIKDCVITNNLKNTVSLPSLDNNIVFSARLWNPINNNEQWKQQERHIINSQRMEIVENMRIAYGIHFKGGIQKDSFSLQQCPDLLLSNHEYHKKNYLKILKNSGIGIVNPGLEQSISWKMGEYVAHSLAIVTTPIKKYKLLGDFQEEKNYMVFNNLDECLEKTEKLFSNDKLRKAMQRANREYYLNYLHPAKKLELILRQIKNA